MINLHTQLAIIRRYEDSVAMPDRERATYLDAQGRIHYKGGDHKANEIATRAAKCHEYLRFGSEVDDVLSDRGTRYSFVKVAQTPHILQKAGFENLPMLYTRRHVRMAVAPKSRSNIHRHGLDLPTLKRFPELFESPVIMADNPSNTSAMMLVLCATDSDGLPLIASVKPGVEDGFYELEEISTNLILTVFGKERFENYFKSVLTPDKIIYFNKERGQDLERLANRQLVGNYSGLDLDTIIREPECIVNRRAQQGEAMIVGPHTPSLTGSPRYKTGMREKPAGPSLDSKLTQAAEQTKHNSKNKPQPQQDRPQPGEVK